MNELVISFILGAFLGSFFYTLSLRYIDGSIKQAPWKALMSRSKCPHCKSNIHPLFLAPLLGFLLLRGKCKNCGKAISAVYPAVEIFSGALFVLMAALLGFSPLTAAAFILCEISLCISVIDLKLMIIPDSLVIAFLCVSLYPVAAGQSYSQNILGFASAAAFFLVIMIIFPGSFGGGDIKLAAAIGLYTGLPLVIVAVEGALITGAITGALLVLSSKKGIKSKIPFAPFLCAGLIIAILWGEKILLLYYNIMS
ncbi:MAG: A24 family peptidase [Leptospirales bacterium]|nr:A24 family peptidase [Leptospirales bacterium]